MSYDRAFVKDLVTKIKQVPGKEGKSNCEVELEIKTKLSFVELFKLYFEVKENNLRFEDVAKRMLKDIMNQDTRLETIES